MIFEEQISRKPDMYPWAQGFIETAQDGFWTHREFNFSSDKQDFLVKLTSQEKEIIIRALATIGQVEVSLKKFWAKLGDNCPHPSLYDLGYTLSFQEVVHGNAYERLLDILGISDSFEKILKLDIISGRINYLRKHLHKFHDDNKKQFIYSLILFTLFVENIALFSQFYTIMFFGKFKNLLKDTNKQVEYTSREECYIEGTEVLTPNGWVDLSKININDDIVQYTEHGEFEFTKVLHKTDKNYSGDMISFSRNANKCIVTPNHDMVYLDNDGNLRKKRASDLKLHKKTIIPIYGKLNNDGDNLLSFEDRLKIAIQADGSNLKWTSKSGVTKLRGSNGGCTHSISLKRERKIKRLEWILDSGNIKYSKKIDKNGYSNYTIYFNHNFNYKNFDWVDLKDKTGQWCEDFITEVIEWDGFKKDFGFGYCSTNKSCIDKVQTIAILAGYATNYYANTKKGYENTPCYKLGIRLPERQPISHGIKKEIVQFNGRVFCVTVPSGMIMTRYSGKTFISGNCLHAQVGVKLINTIKSEHPELFTKDLEEKILHEAEQAVKYESEIVDWILNGYSNENLNSDLVKSFIKNRMNESLSEINYPKIFNIDENLIEKTSWFDEQILGNNQTDFFHSRPVEYSKKNKNFSEEDLF